MCNIFKMNYNKTKYNRPKGSLVTTLLLWPRLSLKLSQLVFPQLVLQSRRLVPVLAHQVLVHVVLCRQTLQPADPGSQLAPAVFELFAGRIVGASSQHVVEVCDRLVFLAEFRLLGEEAFAVFDHLLLEGLNLGEELGTVWICAFKNAPAGKEYKVISLQCNRPMRKHIDRITGS